MRNIFFPHYLSGEPNIFFPHYLSGEPHYLSGEPFNVRMNIMSDNK